MAGWFGKPLIPFLKATQVSATAEEANVLVSQLTKSQRSGDRIAAAALLQTYVNVSYDTSYYQIPYPNGDLVPSKGKAEDVVIRAFRRMELDLQQLVHEDMSGNFRLYPQLWGASTTDTNIDHRRVANLQRFFERNGETLTTSHDAAEYLPGDVVVWSLANGEPHIGIVVPSPEYQAGEAWIVHHDGSAVKWENVLFDHKIQGHFRFPGAAEK